MHIYIYTHVNGSQQGWHTNGSQQGWHTTKYIPSAYFDAHYVMNFTVEIKWNQPFSWLKMPHALPLRCFNFFFPVAIHCQDVPQDVILEP